MTEVNQGQIRLADAIAELRNEIQRARNEGANHEVRFKAKDIEIELSIEFGLSGEANVGVPKWIPFVELGAKGGGSEKSLHKVKMVLGLSDDGLIVDPDGPRPVPPKARSPGEG
jgi:hypothetical protein